jgi:hypothetical protein
MTVETGPRPRRSRRPGAPSHRQGEPVQAAIESMTAGLTRTTQAPSIARG